MNKLRESPSGRPRKYLTTSIIHQPSNLQTYSALLPFLSNTTRAYPPPSHPSSPSQSNSHPNYPEQEAKIKAAQLTDSPTASRTPVPDAVSPSSLPRHPCKPLVRNTRARIHTSHVMGCRGAVLVGAWSCVGCGCGAGAGAGAEGGCSLGGWVVWAGVFQGGETMWEGWVRRDEWEGEGNVPRG